MTQIFVVKQKVVDCVFKARTVICQHCTPLWKLFFNNCKPLCFPSSFILVNVNKPLQDKPAGHSTWPATSYFLWIHQRNLDHELPRYMLDQGAKYPLSLLHHSPQCISHSHSALSHWPCHCLPDSFIQTGVVGYSVWFGCYVIQCFCKHCYIPPCTRRS